jgi:hypothetical protein
MSKDDKKYYDEFREVFGNVSPFSLELTLLFLKNHYLSEKLNLRLDGIRRVLK